METGGVRHRKAHVKSRKGCIRCKDRHVKCDEQSPCSACKKRGVKCEREAQAPTLSRAASFRRFVQVNLSSPSPSEPPATRINDVSSHSALEYFYKRTLPVLRICQPSILWEAMTNVAPQRDIPLRKIAIALGFAHRMGTEPTLSEPGEPFARKALIAYTDAIRSLRECMTQDIDLYAFASLMLVVLESLRKAPSAMLMHLHNGLKLTKIARAASSSSKAVMGEVSRLLERYRVSCLLYELLTIPSADLARLHVDRDEEQSLVACDQQDGKDDVVQQSDVIGGSIQIWRRMSDRSFEDPAQGRVRHLRAQYTSLRSRTVDSSPASDHLGQFAKAQLQLAEVALRSALVPLDVHVDEDETYANVMDNVEGGLKMIRSSEGWHGEEPCPFSIGLGVVSTLGVIAMYSHGGHTRARALSLLEQCPFREGLWDARDIREVCSKSTAGGIASLRNFREMATKRMRSTFAIP